MSQGRIWSQWGFAWCKWNLFVTKSIGKTFWQSQWDRGLLWDWLATGLRPVAVVCIVCNSRVLIQIFMVIELWLDNKNNTVCRIYSDASIVVDGPLSISMMTQVFDSSLPEQLCHDIYVYMVNSMNILTRMEMPITKVAWQSNVYHENAYAWQ